MQIETSISTDKGINIMAVSVGGKVQFYIYLL